MHELLLMLVRFLLTLKTFKTMKRLMFTILFILLLIIIGLAGTNDLQFEELVCVKQLYNVQQDMLKDNFSQQELDSMYREYDYHYLKSYYENNYK